MTVYRRKPDTADAWQYDYNGTYPTWLTAAINNNLAFTYTDRCDIIGADNEMHTANDGDYLLHDTVTGALSAMTATAFAAKWEALP